MDPGSVVKLLEQIDYQVGSVVSRQVVKNDSGSVTLFAFDAGESLSEHSTPHDALVMVLDGEAEISLAGDSQAVGAGQAILLPGGVPHAVAAEQRFIMALIMLKRGD
jgi:quercetin dioxygenase-like cupin family protein